MAKNVESQDVGTQEPSLIQVYQDEVEYGGMRFGNPTAYRLLRAVDSIKASDAGDAESVYHIAYSLLLGERISFEEFAEERMTSAQDLRALLEVVRHYKSELDEFFSNL